MTLETKRFRLSNFMKLMRMKKSNNKDLWSQQKNKPNNNSKLVKHTRMTNYHLFRRKETIINRMEVQMFLEDQ